MVVMAFKIAGSRAARQPHVIYHSDRLIALTGGRDVVDAIEQAIPAYRLTETRAVLRKFGNISSPSVLAALEESLESFPESDTLWLTAFGAGFSAHCGELKRE